MRFQILTTGAAMTLAAFCAPAMAQDVGDTIIGSDDAPVGTVVSNNGSVVVIDTGSYKVPVGVNSFGEVNGAWKMNATKALLDERMAKRAADRAAALSAALVEGASVVTSDGTPVGTVQTINEDAVIVSYEDRPISLPKNLFALNREKALSIRVSYESFLNAVGPSDS